MENKNHKKINFIEFLLSKSKKNKVICNSCKITFPYAHLICFRFFKKDNILYWESKYTVGCSQNNNFEKKKCNDCLTIYNNDIYCLECSKIINGIPDFTDTTRKWIWIDGSTSSISELFIDGDNDWNIINL